MLTSSGRANFTPYHNNAIMCRAKISLFRLSTTLVNKTVDDFQSLSALVSKREKVNTVNWGYFEPQSFFEHFSRKRYIKF
jgi:hypothetical protein